jgi:hypothetical protein
VYESVYLPNALLLAGRGTFNYRSLGEIMNTNGKE